jgi:hypothetical protein
MMIEGHPDMSGQENRYGNADPQVHNEQAV